MSDPGLQPSDIEAIDEPASQVLAEPTAEIAAESKDLDERKRAAEADLAKHHADLAATQVQQARQDLQERKDYANRIFYLIVLWLLFAGGALLLDGFRVRQFDLSDTVMVTLIGSTTGSVVGIFLIVANYLFPNRGKQ